jgi:hypothetical protein
MVIVAILSAGALAVNALGQEVTPPELTLEDAIALAVAHNASLNKASLETRRTATGQSCSLAQKSVRKGENC